ncbi:hypothetical protein CYMTET_55136 [Cymbomonas tetramitiformis]|uniref:Uncharacterized protein n=1 Tax=Cymbomonas tetramitiformis TaxID=36881 RepID=A0AAE0BEJ3_9CHLO|nr:hypothetical protein CYMTET_55136 [Cymbomonas tetramitiformis]|eukprot:gene9459-11209_t
MVWNNVVGWNFFATSVISCAFSWAVFTELLDTKNDIDDCKVTSDDDKKYETEVQGNAMFRLSLVAALLVTIILAVFCPLVGFNTDYLYMRTPRMEYLRLLEDTVTLMALTIVTATYCTYETYPFTTLKNLYGLDSTGITAEGCGKANEEEWVKWLLRIEMFLLFFGNRLKGSIGLVDVITGKNASVVSKDVQP